jgi:iron-sulfur cluster assembly accessory protein
MVRLTPKAAAQVRQLMATTDLREEGLSGNVGLRVGVRPGGCSGFQYSLALDVPGPGDRVFSQEGLAVIVHDQELQYVQGAEVDFVESFQSTGFEVHNPNVVASCGCGSSFHVADEAPAAV